VWTCKAGSFQLMVARLEGRLATEAMGQQIRCEMGQGLRGVHKVTRCLISRRLAVVDGKELNCNSPQLKSCEK